MSHSPEHIAKVLSDIQKKVPETWRKNVVEEIDMTPTIMMVMNKALESDGVSDEKKREIQALKDKGEFSKKVLRENPVFAKKIDQFVARHINLEIKRGNLPPKSKIKNLAHVREIYEKVHSSTDKK